MRNIDSFLQKSSGEDKANENHFIAQFNKVYLEYFEEPQSMKSVAKKLEIDRSSVCWYNRLMRLNGRIWVAKKARCPYSKRIVFYYTTNPRLVPPSGQLSLFDQ